MHHFDYEEEELVLEETKSVWEIHQSTKELARTRRIEKEKKEKERSSNHTYKKNSKKHKKPRNNKIKNFDY